MLLVPCGASVMSVARRAVEKWRRVLRGCSVWHTDKRQAMEAISPHIWTLNYLIEEGWLCWRTLSPGPRGGLMCAWLRGYAKNPDARWHTSPDIRPDGGKMDCLFFFFTFLYAGLGKDVPFTNQSEEMKQVSEWALQFELLESDVQTFHSYRHVDRSLKHNLICVRHPNICCRLGEGWEIDCAKCGQFNGAV